MGSRVRDSGFRVGVRVQGLGVRGQGFDPQHTQTDPKHLSHISSHIQEGLLGPFECLLWKVPPQFVLGLVWGLGFGV